VPEVENLRLIKTTKRKKLSEIISIAYLLLQIKDVSKAGMVVEADNTADFAYFQSKCKLLSFKISRQRRQILYPGENRWV
jgi:hypothetical protein